MRKFFGNLVLAAIVAIATLGQARADIITVQSDGNTLAAGLGAEAPDSSMFAALNSGDTAGLTFTSALVGAFGTFTPVPPGAPAATEVINIPPGDGENGFFQIDFTLPSGFSNFQLSGAGNVDDIGRVFLNGNPISPVLNTVGNLTEYGNVTFSTSNDSFFNAGNNVLLLADANTGGGPSGAAFFANITYGTSAVPEPSTFALLGLGGLGLAFGAYRRRQMAGA